MPGRRGKRETNAVCSLRNRAENVGVLANDFFCTDGRSHFNAAFERQNFDVETFRLEDAVSFSRIENQRVNGRQCRNTECFRADGSRANGFGRQCCARSEQCCGTRGSKQPAAAGGLR